MLYQSTKFDVRIQLVTKVTRSQSPLKKWPSVSISLRLFRVVVWRQKKAF